MNEGSSSSSSSTRPVRRRVARVRPEYYVNSSRMHPGLRADDGNLSDSSPMPATRSSATLTNADRRRLERFETSLADKGNAITGDDLRQIDAELDYIDAIALRLRARRNASQPIARLPSEMVAEIVCLVAATSVPHRPFLRVHDRGVVADTGRTRSDLGWIRLAHVCRRWRAIVLQLPTLWAHEVCALVGAEEDMLRHARAVPLTLALNAHMHRIDPKTVAFVQQHVYRARAIEIREVLLHPHPAAWPAGAGALAGRHLPSLESLCLDLKPSRNSPITHDAFSSPPLNAPRLRRLELTNIFVPWAPAPNLTELVLSRCDFQNLAVVPPPDLLLSLLGSCPQLRKLHLLGWIPDLPVPRLCDNRGGGGVIDDPNEQIIALPYLEEMSLTSSTRRIISFWTRIRIPSTADVRLRLDPAHLDLTVNHPQHDPERYELIRTIGPHFAPAFLPTAPRRIVGVSIFDFPDEESLRFCLFTRAPGQENAGQEAQWTGPFARDYAFRLDIQCYRWDMSAAHFIAMLRHVLDSFDFARLETLELMSQHRGHAADWQNTLARVTSPTVLSFDGMPNRELLDALGAPLPSAQSEPSTAAVTTMTTARAQEDPTPPLPSLPLAPPKLLFPHMRTLYLSASTEREWLADFDAQSDVLDMLQSRQEAGVPVEHLILDEVALPPQKSQAQHLLGHLRLAVSHIEVKQDKGAAARAPSTFMPWDGSFLIPVPQMIPLPGVGMGL